MIRKISFAVVSLCFAALTAGAQALPFVAAEMSAHSMSLAGSDAVLTSDVANAAFTNSAAIPFSDKKMDVAVGYTMWQPSQAKSNVLNVAGAYNLNGKFGVALGFRYGMNPSYTISDESGSGKGTFSPSDMQINAGFSWKFLPFLSVGVNLGYASSSIAEGHSYGAFTSDIFLMSKISDFKVALGVSDLGSSVKSVTGAKFALPSAITLGAGYQKEFAEKHGVDVLVDADYYFEGAFSASVGAEYTFNRLVSLRAGYRYGAKSVLPSYASVGAGVQMFGVKLDLAYVIAPSSPMKNTLALQLGYRF